MKTKNEKLEIKNWFLVFLFFHSSLLSFFHSSPKKMLYTSIQNFFRARFFILN